jgi:AP-1 complex subunit beta-1
VLPISHSNLQKLQAALNECTEWGQVFILDALAQYQPSNSREAEALVERVLPRLNHANSAVVLSAVKICMKFLDVIENEDFTRALLRKLGPSLVTLLSREPEVQYVALRNINLVVQKRPAILAHEIKVFYCKYNDPVYVKLEKLEIMIRLAGERNIDQVLLEFKEYATEVDVDFVRKSVRAIGRCAVKIEKAAERCINVLLELIQTKVNYVVQEAIVVIKDIFRRYPDKYESIIATLCESLERLDEPEAKGSMIWIIGEYAGRIDNADALLESFLDSFADEPCEVQLQLLTATVKLFLKKPTETQEMVQKVLTMTTQMVDNPDLRDRGFLYWRLLSTDPEAAKRVVLADKPVISDDTNSLDAAHLDTLIGLMSTLSSVYHKVPEAFVNKGKVAVREEEDDDEGHHEDDDGPTPAELRDREMGSHAGGGTVAPVVDLLDLNLGGPEPAAAAGGAVSGLVSGGGGGGGGAAGAGTSDLDLGSLFGAPAAPASQPAHSQQRSKPVLVTAEKGKGLVVEGAFNRRQGSIYFDLTLRNTTAAALGNFAIQFNKNSFGVAVPTDRLPISSLAGSSSADVAVPCVISQDKVKPGPLAGSIQIALNSNLGIIYFESPLHLHAVFTEDGRLDKSHFLQLWKDFGDANERSFVVRDLDSDAPEHVQAVLEQRNVFFIARRDVGAQIVMYYAAKASTGMAVLMELTLAPGSRACKAAVKLPNLEAVPLVEAALKDLLVSGQAPAAQPFAQPSSSNNNNVLIGSLI